MGRLIDSTVLAFDEELGSASPAPGGGSAAALAGSLAAALVTMVCHLSLGRADIAATDEELTQTLATAEGLRSRLLELVDEDTASFDAVMDAIRLPKADEAQRAARAAAFAKATLGAAAVPLETLAAARQTLVLAAALAGRANPATASDLGVAVQLARAGAEGALLNVAINLASVAADDEGERYRRESQSEIQAAREAAAAASATIAGSLGLE